MPRSSEICYVNATLHIKVKACLLKGLGAVAQLGERCVRNAEVGSSILLGSTNLHDNAFTIPLAPVAQLDRAIAS